MNKSNFLKNKKEQELISVGNFLEEPKDDWFSRDLKKQLTDEEV